MPKTLEEKGQYVRTRCEKIGGKFMAELKRFPPSTIGQKH
jgi:hypothetical protein